MKLSQSPKFKANYAAKIVEIKEFHAHSNPEVTRLKCCKVDGFNIITGIDSEPGFYIYFPVECCIENEFLSKNNLYRDASMNVDHEKTGMFEDKGRVKAIRLKGEVSEGFIIPTSSLSVITDSVWEDASLSGEDFDTVDGKLLCKKYVPKYQRTPGSPGSKQGKQPKKTAEAEVVEGQFRFHVDTTLLKKCPYVIKPDSLISITAKVHGTSGISANVKIRKALPKSFMDKILRREKFVEEYHSFCTSRKVIQDPLLNPTATGYYGGADKKGRNTIHELLFGNLPKGMTVYYEILGYWPNGTPIQGKWDYGFEKPDVGDGKLPRRCDWILGQHYGVEVYRITYTNEEGAVFEFSSRQVQLYCEKMGWTPVEQYYYGYAKDLYPDLDISNHWNENFLDLLMKDKRFYMELQSPRCINKAPHEGIVIRNESLNIDVYKLKCFAFLEKERVALDKGEFDIEEDQ